MTKASRLRPLAKAVLRTQSDDRLVALAREGRDTAFEEIVRRYRPGLVAFAAAYAPPDRTEDVVQESLVRSWQALGQATEEIHLKPWLYTIVRNRALNARRDAKLHEQLSDDVDGVPQPPEIVLDREQLDSVIEAVGALPEPQRQALVRSALEGHTHQQIAAALGSTPGAVRQLIYRARLNLRSGVGLLIPLPLVRLLSEHGAETTAAATGVAAGSAALGTAGGASALSKVAAIAAVSTIAAGAGVAIDRSKDDRAARETTVEQRSDSGAAADTSRDSGTAPAGADSSGPGPGAAATGSGEGRGENESGDDSGEGSDDSGEGSSDSGPSASAGPSTETEPDDDRSGPGGGGDSDNSGSNSGPGSGGDDPPDAEEDNSGPGGGGGGSGHSGSGGGGSSGSGSSGSGSSGSGSGSSGSGSDSSGSGSDSSGSGSDGSGSGDKEELADLPDPD